LHKLQSSAITLICRLSISAAPSGADLKMIDPSPDRIGQNENASIVEHWRTTRTPRRLASPATTMALNHSSRAKFVDPISDNQNDRSRKWIEGLINANACAEARRSAASSDLDQRFD
jgi:hypothetical protein